MSKNFASRMVSDIRARVHGLGLAAAMIAVAAVAATAAAQTNPYSPYIPSAVPTATTTLYTAGTTAIAPGRVGVDRAGNVFYIGHPASGTATLYEIPAAVPAATVTTPTAIISGIGMLNSNSVFVDAAGNLWFVNGNGAGGPLFEIPAAKGVPNISAITGSSSYTATGLPLAGVITACSATSTAACVWSAASISSTFSGLQLGDVYSDGVGNVYLVDLGDNVSNGTYNRVIQFSTRTPGTASVLADKITTNTYAQVTVPGDGNVYYCDSVTGNSKGGAVYLLSNGSRTLVENTATSNLTLLNAIVKVTSATGITVDPWGDLIISGAKQISEVPLEQGGALNFVDQYNLLIAVTGSNSPVYNNNVVYGGSVDQHGNYYFASTTNVMVTEVGGHNFGAVNVGTEVTTAAPYIDITWNIPTQLVQSGAFPTSSPSGLSTANAALLQSFPNANSKNFFGGTPYSASTTGSYLLMYFQPVHPGLLLGADAPQGYANYIATTDPGGTTLGQTEYAATPAYTVSLQGVGVGPQSLFLPGTPSVAISLPQLYTSQTHATKAVGFSPTAVAVDTYGDIFAADSTNSSVDLDCLATTNNAATALASFCQANGYGYTYKVNYTLNKTLKPVSFVNPADVVLDAANSAFVLDSGANTPILTKLPYDTMIPSVVIPSGTIVGGVAMYKPQGITIDGYGNLYIADTGNNRIVQARPNNAQYSENTIYVPTTLLFGSNALNAPGGMGVDAAGDLFIADTGNARVVEYSVTGVPSVVSTPGVTLTAPTSVKVLPSGALVIADSKLGLVLVNNGAAQVLSTGTITLASTGGLSLDLFGNIYVADPVGGQVVELKISAPGAASFPATLKPDATGSHTSTETSFIYNSGNAPLVLSATPTVTDNTSSATNEFSLDSKNACTSATSLAPAGNCSLVLDFTPSATAAVYTNISGTATVPDNVQGYTVIANPAFGSGAIGSFTNTGSSQNVNLSAMAVVPFTPQTITFTGPAAVNYSASIPPFQLVATGGATGNPVVFSIVSGQGTLSGPNNSILTVNNNGTTVIAANQAGGLVNGVYYSAAPTVTQSIVINPIGTVATPTFSVPAGTYTAVQSVSISDATPGATIYYTTNGNNPTISSPVYTGQPIQVTISTTVKAFAVGAPGFAASPIATAVYTLNPDFILTPYAPSLTIPNGLGSTTTITITPLFGFSGQVVLTCTGLTSGDSCSFLDRNGNPTNQIAVNSTTLVNGSAYGSMIVQAGETASLSKPGWQGAGFSGVSLALLLFVGGFRKRKRLATLLLLMLGAVGASMITGCGADSLTGRSHTSTFNLVATSGSVTHSQTINLVVDNLGN